jgi:hypothetical protein
MGCEAEVASLEKELLVGHSKCIRLLFNVDNARSQESIRKVRTRPNYERRIAPTGEEKLVKALKWSQIIKSVSYYLGYPLAKAVLEKYGVRGVKFALEKHLPLEAQYFANPEVYLARLEELAAVFEERR